MAEAILRERLKTAREDLNVASIGGQGEIN